MLESLLTTYGYPAIILGTFLEGETLMILAGVAAHLGYLSLDWVIVCGFCGTFFGDQLYFFLGRRHGKSMLASRTSWQAPCYHRSVNSVSCWLQLAYRLRSSPTMAIR